MRTQDKYPVFMKNQRQFFDELITSEWETYLNSAWNAARQFEVDRLFERISPKRVLDIGCGCGYHDILMAQKTSVETVIGIDYSERSIETANREYPHSKIERYVADIFELSKGDFDLVVSFQVIEHLSDASAFLTACARQVRPGGWVAVATPNRKRLMNRLIAYAGYPPMLADPQHFHEYTTDELSRIGVKIGLSFKDSFGSGLSIVIPRLHWRLLPSRFGLRVGYWCPKLADCIYLVFQV